MIDEQTQQLSAYRIEKATTLLAQAELLLKNQQYDGSVNRSYYAIFNAVRAILALVRLDSQSHRGVISFFDRYFVKTGIFEKQFSTMVHEAFDTRQDNDYEDFYQPTETEAQEQFEHATQFLQETKHKHSQFLQGTLSLPTVT
ncbi:MAG: HEPN domain-containing protein [bacterium]|nr:HEPN domain-containing protein [bacterium]